MSTKSRKPPTNNPSTGAPSKNPAAQTFAIPTGQRLWVWLAAAAAWHVADPSDDDGETDDWHDMSPIAAAARFYYWRAVSGEKAVDDLRALIKLDLDGPDEVDPDLLELPKPRGFKNWDKLAAALFEQVGVVPNAADLEVGSKHLWSVYHVTIARDADDPLYDASCEEAPPYELVASIDEYGGAYDPIKVAVRAKGVIVIDGRQRTAAIRQINRQRLERYYDEVDRILRGEQRQELQALAAEFRNGKPERARKVDDVPLPQLLRGVNFIVHALEAGQELKVISNTCRKRESALQEARACYELVVQCEGSTSRAARLRGCNEQTVRNALILHKLPEEWYEEVRRGVITVSLGYKLGQLDKKRLASCHKEFKKKHFFANNRGAADKWVTAWLAGEKAPADARDVVSIKRKALTHDRAALLADRLAKLGDSPEAKLVRNVLAAITSDSREAMRALPVAWRTALDGREVLWDGFGLVGQRAAWEAAGVYDPETAMSLARADVKPDQAALPVGVSVKRGQPVKSRTFGAAIEAGELVVDDLVKWLNQREMFADGPPAVSPGTLPPGQLALPPAPAKKSKGQKAKNPWGGFTTEQRQAWLDAAKAPIDGETARAFVDAGMSLADAATEIDWPAEEPTGKATLAAIVDFGGLTVEQARRRLGATVEAGAAA